MKMKKDMTWEPQEKQARDTNEGKNNHNHKHTNTDDTDQRDKH
jgi:hypothetical protein